MSIVGKEISRYLRELADKFDAGTTDYDEEQAIKFMQLITHVPMTKEEVEELLSRQGVMIERGQLHDCVYVANMCKADFLGSSVPEERHMVLYIKDVIDDVDAPDGLVFNRFYADCCYKGIAIEWEDML